MKKVSIIEDCPALGRLLSGMINASGRYRCVSTYANATSARRGLINDSPNIVIFDIGLPDGSGIDCVRWLKPRMVKTEFLAFTGRDDKKTILEALRAGATGYLCKGAKPAEVLRALDDLAAGGSAFSPDVARKMAQSFSEESPGLAPLPATLTRREKEILDEIVRGHMLKEITATLSISQGTLNTHMSNLYRKLGVHSRNEIMTRYFCTNPAFIRKGRTDGRPNFRTTL